MIREYTNKCCLECGNEFTVRNLKRQLERSFCSSKCAKYSNGKGNKGNKHTEEFKQNLRVKMLGAGNHFYGKSHSKETREILSAQRIGIKKENPLSLKDRVLNNIKIDSNGCWIWQGWKRSKGDKGDYGGLKIVGQSMLAHRASYIVHKGEIPKGLLVCHSCDVTMCVNPDHLFLGTQTDNMRDMASKNRGPNVLTKDQVIEIRKLKGVKLYKQIASDYNVCATVISSIMRYKTWKNI